MQNKESKNDKTNVQDEDDVNKDSKVIKGKKIRAKSIRQLQSIEGFDNTDDNQDDIIDNKDSKKRSRRRSRKETNRGGPSDDEEGTGGGDEELEREKGNYRSSLLHNDEIADRLER